MSRDELRGTSVCLIGAQEHLGKIVTNLFLDNKHSPKGTQNILPFLYLQPHGFVYAQYFVKKKMYTHAKSISFDEIYDDRF